MGGNEKETKICIIGQVGDEERERERESSVSYLKRRPATKTRGETHICRGAIDLLYSRSLDSPPSQSFVFERRATTIVKKDSLVKCYFFLSSFLSVAEILVEEVRIDRLVAFDRGKRKGEGEERRDAKRKRKLKVKGGEEEERASSLGGEKKEKKK